MKLLNQFCRSRIFLISRQFFVNLSSGMICHFMAEFARSIAFQILMYNQNSSKRNTVIDYIENYIK